jgi:nucleoside-diphosphate-sugar epimerase
VVNVGAENPEVPVQRLAEVVIATVGKPLTIAARPATPGSPSRRAPNMTRLEGATGRKARTTLEDGVRLTYQWYRTHVFAQG